MCEAAIQQQVVFAPNDVGLSLAFSRWTAVRVHSRLATVVAWPEKGAQNSQGGTYGACEVVIIYMISGGNTTGTRPHLVESM